MENHSVDMFSGQSSHMVSHYQQQKSLFGGEYSMAAVLQQFFFPKDIQDTLLTRSMRLPLAVASFYVIFVKWLGPMLMSSRKPFSLRVPMVTYGAAQAIVNAYVAAVLVRFMFRAAPDHCDIQNSPRYNLYVKEHIMTFYHLMLIKYSDLVDTVFFVLRKKSAQVSVLHVFHHVAMCLIGSYASTMGTKSGGYFLLLALAINTCVHTVMYTYYGLAALGPAVRKYLWWKRYITQIQITQFVIILAYMTYGFLSGCEKLRAFEITIYACVATILLLFLRFYRNAFSTTKTNHPKQG